MISVPIKNFAFWDFQLSEIPSKKILFSARQNIPKRFGVPKIPHTLSNAWNTKVFWDMQTSILKWVQKSNWNSSIKQISSFSQLFYWKNWEPSTFLKCSPSQGLSGTTTKNLENLNFCAKNQWFWEQILGFINKNFRIHEFWMIQKFSHTQRCIQSFLGLLSKIPFAEIFSSVTFRHKTNSKFY